MSARNPFVFRLHLIGVTAVVALMAVSAVLLWIGTNGNVKLVAQGSAVFLVFGIALERYLVWLLLDKVLKQTGRAARIASRVAQGDLTMPEGKAPKDPLTASIAAMLEKLRELVGAILRHAHDAAAMSEEIAASTQQMTASTQEVAGTTGDLTERA
ncbi:MAG: methyl-accepting chemotaxis protein, partial [Gemmatimonadales bacterium]